MIVAIGEKDARGGGGNERAIRVVAEVGVLTEEE